MQSERMNELETITAPELIREIRIDHSIGIGAVAVTRKIMYLRYCRTR
ncbi:hypothetical protein [Acidicapsa ligni]|nr:hypothetical protein [Acidicapsa ligni]